MSRWERMPTTPPPSVTTKVPTPLAFITRAASRTVPWPSIETTDDPFVWRISWTVPIRFTPSPPRVYPPPSTGRATEDPFRTKPNARNESLDVSGPFRHRYDYNSYEHQ